MIIFVCVELHIDILVKRTAATNSISGRHTTKGGRAGWLVQRGSDGKVQCVAYEGG